LHAVVRHLIIATALIAGCAHGDAPSGEAENHSRLADTCQPPRAYQYVLGLDEWKTLACGADTTIFDVAIPDRGRALARVTLAYSNNAAAQTYFWSTAVAVGREIVSFYNGDDVCPGTYRVRSTMGYGELDDQDARVVVRSHQGSSPCSDGTVSVFSGGYLDVWVEDASCPGQDIMVASFYRDTGVGPLYSWQTTMAPLNQLVVERHAGRSRYHLLGSVEGTPNPDPNTVCGQESATLVSQLTAGGGIVAQTIDTIPASQGMGHLVLATEATVDAPLGTTLVSHDVGSNTSAPVTTGGCCGDGMLAVIEAP
jgi:hypothetical protein